MSRANIATYRIAGLAICSFLLFGCGSGTEPGATLSSLSISGATLNPAFSPSVFSYTANVPNGTNFVVVSATKSNELSKIRINGGRDTTVPLVVGDNTISIMVILDRGFAGKETNTYTIVVTRATSVVDTTVGWNGEESLAPFGKGSIGTGAHEVFGQTFVVLADAPTFQRLSFWLQHSPNDTSGEDVFFSVVVMAWNTDRATGPVLYESALQSITTAQSTMTEYLVDTGGLPLVPGQYIAFLSANNGFWNTTSTPIHVGFQNADVYSQGAAWILNTDNDLNRVTSAPWMNPSGTADLVVMLSF